MFITQMFDSVREAKKESSSPIEASPQGPLEITILSSTNSDSGTDLDAITSVDQATDSPNSGLTIFH